MTTRQARTHTPRHQITSRKDQPMFQIDVRLADVQRRQAELRAQRELDRLVAVSREPSRSLRLRLGWSLVRLGRRVAGESLGSPAPAG